MGTLYCVSVGYLYAFVTMLIAEYRMIVGLAAGITILVCMAMFLLYRSGKVTVNNKLRTVVFTLIFANIVGVILLVICSFIPALTFIPAFFTGNGIISIAISAVGVVIATLFVLIDFDTVAKAVENEIPVENEWYCAFSLAFSVIWLFGKIFNLLVKVFAAAKK